jgi:hypothetical protein
MHTADNCVLHSSTLGFSAQSFYRTAAYDCDPIISEQVHVSTQKLI